MTDDYADYSSEELAARITYLEQALTPGTQINSSTTFYVGKGEQMRAELAALRLAVRHRRTLRDS